MHWRTPPTNYQTTIPSRLQMLCIILAAPAAFAALALLLAIYDVVTLP